MWFASEPALHLFGRLFPPLKMRGFGINQHYLTYNHTNDDWNHSWPNTDSGKNSHISHSGAALSLFSESTADSAAARSRAFQAAHINVIDHCQLLCFLQRQITAHWWISLSFSSKGSLCFHYFLSVFFSPITCLLYCTQSLESDKLRNWIKVSIKRRLLWALTSELARLQRYRMKPEEDISLPER